MNLFVSLFAFFLLLLTPLAAEKLLIGQEYKLTLNKAETK